MHLNIPALDLNAFSSFVCTQVVLALFLQLGTLKNKNKKASAHGAYKVLGPLTAWFQGWELGQ